MYDIHVSFYPIFSAAALYLHYLLVVMVSHVSSSGKFDIVVPLISFSFLISSVVVLPLIFPLPQLIFDASSSNGHRPLAHPTGDKINAHRGR